MENKHKNREFFTIAYILQRTTYNERVIIKYMGYQQAFLQGVGWSGGLKLSSKVLTAVKLAILARLLRPEDFGLFSLVLVSLSLVEVFAETGINTVIVQSDKHPTHFLDTAWVISIVRGIVIAGIMLTISWPLQFFYQQDTLFPLVVIASIVPIIRGFINPGIVTLHKNLEFQKDTVYRFLLALTDVIASVILALMLRNVLALILGIIVHAVIDVILSYLFVSLRPRFKWNRIISKEIFQHTKWLNSFSVIDYLNKNIDDLIIGRILGVANLGFYRNAYAATQSGTAELGLSVIHASFPVYTKIKADKARLRKAFIKVVMAFSGLLLVPTLLFIFFPTLIVKILLGDNWLPLVPLLPILAIAGYIQGIFNIGTSLFVSQKQYRWMLCILTITLLSMVISIIPLSQAFGLKGAALSILISRIAPFPVFIVALRKTLYTPVPHET